MQSFTYSLSLVFWLVSSVDYRTTNLFLRASALFSHEDILPWSTSTSFFSSEISFLDFVLISFFADSGCLATYFHFSAHIALHLVNYTCILYFLFLYVLLILFFIIYGFLYDMLTECTLDRFLCSPFPVLQNLGCHLGSYRRKKVKLRRQPGIMEIW